MRSTMMVYLITLKVQYYGWPSPTKWALGNDGQYTQITNGTTVLATATDGSVRQIILGVLVFCWSYNQW
jgi:hypothetical protein